MGNSSFSTISVQDAESRFTERELSTLENGFSRLCSSSSASGSDWVDEDTFQYFLLSEFPCMPSVLAKRLFLTWDVDNNSKLAFSEFLCGLCIITRGSAEERLEFLFRFYDLGEQGVITKDTLLRFDELVRETSSYKNEDHWTGLAMVEEAFATSFTGGKVSNCELEFPEFRKWGFNYLGSPLLSWTSQLGTKLLSSASLGGYDKSFEIRNMNSADGKIKSRYGESFLVPVSPPMEHSEKLADSRKKEATVIDRVEEVSRAEHEAYRKLHIPPSKNNLFVEDRWYVISKQWVDEWLSFIGVGDDSTDASMSSNSTTNRKGLRRKRPGRINNSHLIEMLRHGISESGDEKVVLRQDLLYGHDYLIFNEELWLQLKSWYGGGPQIARSVVQYFVDSVATLELELYPVKITVKCLCDEIRISETRSLLVSKANTMLEVEEMVISLFFDVTEQNSRSKNSPTESIRSKFEYIKLWKVLIEQEDLIASGGISENKYFHLLSDRNQTVEEVKFASTQLIILQVFVKECLNSDNASPSKSQTLLNTINLKSPRGQAVLCGGQNQKIESQEVVSSHNELKEENQSDTKLARSRVLKMRQSVVTEAIQGIKGLRNLGNTCFMNAALQCLVHTNLLAYYFLSGAYLNDVKPTNSSEGELADAFGDLIRTMWKVEGKSACPSVAPRRLKNAIGAIESKFMGMEQQDAQELLSALLNGLAEDLNRVQEKPYVELADSNGRPDQVVAREWWSNHIQRELCIITALFTGQFKSLLQCTQCEFDSARFEPFIYLSLPLPQSTFRVVPIVVIFEDPEEAPLICSVRVSKTGTVADLVHQMLLLQPGLSGKKKMGQACIKANGLLKITKGNGEMQELNSKRKKEACKLVDGEFILAQISDRSVMKVIDGGKHGSEPLSAVREGIPLYVFQTAVIGTCKQTCVSFGKDSSASKPIGARVVCDRNGEKIQGVIAEAFYNGDSQSSGAASLPDTKRARTGQHFDIPPEVLVKFQVVGRNGTHFHKHKVKSASLNHVVSSSITVVLTQRQWQHQTAFLFNPLKPVSVGIPFILKIVPECTTTLELYRKVASRLGRGLSSCSVKGDSVIGDKILDGESTANAWGFKIVVISRRGGLCPRCPWIKACYGCCIIPGDTVLSLEGIESDCTLAIDWGTALSKKEALWASRGSTAAALHSSYEVASNDENVTIPISMLMKNFIKKEMLTGVDQVYCSKCKGFSDHTKQIELWRGPPILVVHLKRFQHTSYRRRKMKNLVTYPLTDFNLVDYLATGDCEATTKACETSTTTTESKRKNGNDFIESLLDGEHVGLRSYGGKFHGEIATSYNLYAVVEHTGSLGAGHYVALVRRHVDKKWYCFDDEQVYEVDESRVLSRNAYVLFYVRKDVECMETLNKLFPCEPVSKERLESRLKRFNSSLDEEQRNESCVIQ